MESKPKGQPQHKHTSIPIKDFAAAVNAQLQLLQKVRSTDVRVQKAPSQRIMKSEMPSHKEASRAKSGLVTPDQKEDLADRGNAIMEFDDANSERSSEPAVVSAQ